MRRNGKFAGRPVPGVVGVVVVVVVGTCADNMTGVQTFYFRDEVWMIRLLLEIRAKSVT